MFSSDGRWLIVGGADGMARFWALLPESLIELACRTAGRNFTPEEWQQYFPTDKHSPTCSDADFSTYRVVVSQHLLDIGTQLAYASHKVDEATAKYKEAKKLNPELTFDPETEAKRVAAQPLIEEGRSLAQAGKVDEAIDKFKAALRLNPTLEIDPITEAKQVAVMGLIGRGQNLLQSGDVTGTLAALSQTQTLSPTLMLTTALTANEWNNLCWAGSTRGLAAQVLSACEKAVVLTPKDGGIRDSRGLARALTGNIQGAKEDFEFAVELAKQTNDRKEFIQQRQAWIDALNAGKKPTDIFDAKTLKELKNQ